MRHLALFLRCWFGIVGIFVLLLSSAWAQDRGSRKPGEATPAEALTVLDGFKVDLLRSSQPGEGSWVSMTVDDAGRLIVSPQDGEPMLRFTIDKDGHIARMETIDLPVKGAMGLLYLSGSLYVNGSGPEGYHFYRLTDTDKDDRYDKYELLRKWKGGPGEHGSHGIVKGPDGKLYIVNGNFVDVPDDILPTSPHRNYRDDLVLPRMEDGNGFGAGRKPPGGFVVRLDLDGKNAELFASGQRNTYDIAFNTAGELFGFDSDMEWDWGAPWYRPTRVYHIVSGGDQGFREGSGKWPEYFPDSLPASVDIGIGSPTGVRFGTGAKFPEKYQRALFIQDWSYGRILAVHLKPDGASYTGSFENFVNGKPLNVTDVEVGKDGAMYFTIGGRKTQGGLYRVTYVGKDGAGKDEELAKAEAAAKPARELRHRLEAFHARRDPSALDTAWPHLDSSDRFVRYAARIAVESQPVEQWRQRSLEETRKRAGVTALLALARCGVPEDRDRLLESLGRHWPTNMNDDEKVEALRVCEVACARMGTPTDDVARDVMVSLKKVFPATNWRLNRELSQLLVALNAPGIAKDLLDLRDRAATQEEQLHYMVTLRNVKSDWNLDLRKRYFAWFINRPKTEDGGPTYPGGASYFISRNTRHPEQTLQWFKDVGRDYGDGASFNNFLNNLSKAVVANLTEAEKTELEPLLAALPTPTQRRPAKKTYKFVREWKTADILPDLEKIGHGRNFSNGRDAFAAAQCLQCHRFGNDGGAVGPDITAVASRFSRKDILEATLEPSKVVSEQYQNVTITKKDGDDVTGRLLEESESRLVLVPNQLTGEKVEIKRSDVASRAPSKLSPMPEGLVNVLTKEDLLDLLAYVESGGKRDHPVFKP
jgi:putative heme-binding domain-containing protein